MASLYASALSAAPGDCLVLRHGAHTATVAPTAGGRILNWSTQLATGRKDWLVPVTATEWPAQAWPKGGIFPLAPFSNRVCNAQLHWQDQVIELEPLPGTPHALHGQAQTMTWHVTEATESHAVLSLDHPAGLGGWPWCWHLQQTIELTDAGLSVALTLENHDTTAMPAGLGIHPYFTAHRAQLTAKTRWVHEQELALYAERNTDAQWTRQEDVTWTDFLCDWDGRAHIGWADGTALILRCQGPLTHAILHCNAGRYLCVEPATHVCDAFNLAAQGMAGTGIQVLAPGSTLTVRMMLSVVAATLRH
ncbi:MAG TPA: aldose epimerase [Castellaniella sp.]|uniref:aldose epimerase family protein n=1 Tax=Castellaniella sp. TaxID=1955812 RepID=UPI002EE4832A